MSKKYSFLILTDHRVHKPSNPLYSLVPELLQHPQCGSVHIASRGNPNNDPFFYKRQESKLEVLKTEEAFSFKKKGKQFLSTGIIREISTFDCILMRLTRPIEPDFWGFLAQFRDSSKIINDPLGIQKTSDKSFLMNFQDLCPPMRLVHSKEEVKDFAQHFPIVLKPLNDYGGRGILKVDGVKLFEGSQEHFLDDYLHGINPILKKEGYLAMKFLQQVSQGDKRILLLDEKIMGASLRLPKEGSWLCNVAQGGKSIASDVLPEEEEIIARLIPVLKQEGILLAGIDTLMGDDGKRVLSEINTLSVGGFLNLQEQSGRPVIKQTVQLIIKHVNQKA